MPSQLRKLLSPTKGWCASTRCFERISRLCQRQLKSDPGSQISVSQTATPFSDHHVPNDALPFPAYRPTVVRPCVQGPDTRRGGSRGIGPPGDSAPLVCDRSSGRQKIKERTRGGSVAPGLHGYAPPPPMPSSAPSWLGCAADASTQRRASAGANGGALPRSAAKP